MGKKMLGVLLAFFFVTGLVAAGNVMPVDAAGSGTISVHGKLTEYTSGNPVQGARVNIYCDGKLVAISAPSDQNGNFVINVDASRCPVGGDLVATTSINDISGTGTSVIKDDNDMSLLLQKTTNVPEYGWLSGAATIGAAAGAIGFIRRRPQQDVQS